MVVIVIFVPQSYFPFFCVVYQKPFDSISCHVKLNHISDGRNLTETEIAEIHTCIFC